MSSMRPCTPWIVPNGAPHSHCADPCSATSPMRKRMSGIVNECRARDDDLTALARSNGRAVGVQNFDEDRVVARMKRSTVASTPRP